MLRKAAAALLLAVPVLSVGVAVTAQDSVTIRALIRPDEGGNVALAVERFKEETGIDVQVDFVGWSEIYNTTVTTLAAGGGGYDIVFIPSANVAEFTAPDYFLPINDAIPADERDQWLPSVLDLYTKDGDLIAMPWYAGGAHFTANLAALEGAGVDPDSIETWQDVAAACQAIMEAGSADWCFTPSAKYPANFYYNWGTMAAASGAPIIADDGTPGFEASGLAALQWLKDGVDAGYVNPAGAALDDYETLIEFGTGSTAFMINSTWSVTQAARNTDLSTITGGTQIMLIPGWEGGPRSGGYLYAGGLGVLRSSEHAAEAVQFLQLLTSAELQKQHAIDGANLPTRLALYEDADIAAAWPGFAQLAEQLTYGFFPPALTWLEEWRIAADGATQDVISGRSTPQEAIDFMLSEAARLSAE